MELPARERAYYAASPLAEVIAQIRFPPQLALQEQGPVELQKAFSEHYPYLETRNTFAFQFQVEGSAEPSRLAAPTGMVAWDFWDRDKKTKITVASDFLAVSTSAYTQWEDFKKHIEVSVKSFMGIYSPPLFTRIGLRYQNAIRAGELKINKVSPANLFARELLGTYAMSAFKSKGYESFTNLETAQGSDLNLRFVAAIDQDAGRTYVIDTDVFTDTPIKADADAAIEKLDTFHSDASHIFRWCIKDRLHKALGPQPC